MILLKRLIPIIAGLVFVYCSAQLLLYPGEWQRLATVMIVVGFASLWHLLKWELLSLEAWWQAIPAILWIASGYGFFLFADSSLFQWSLVIGLPVVFGLYLETIFTYRYQPQKYTNLLLPKFSQYLIILSSFFTFAFLFALVLINSIPLWALFVIAFLYGVLGTAHVMRGFHLLEREQMGLIFWMGLLCVQLAGVIYFLPTNYIVAGGVFGAFFYAVPSIIVMQLRDSVDKKAIFQYTLVTLCALFLIFLTAQWV